MPGTKHQVKSSDRIAEYTQLIAQGTVAEVQEKLKELHPAELTTVTDLIGFLAFLGLAALYLI